MKTMKTPTLRPLIQAAAIAACLASASPALAQQAERHYFNGTDFKGGQVVIPKSAIDNPDTKRWVIVDVHGAGGPKKNWFGYRLLKTFGEDKVIALAPVFGKGYHLSDEAASKQFIENFEWIKRNYNVHDKMFLYGHSGGAQFVHRFAFKHPEYVIGVSAHSAGSWAGIEGWGEINDAAKGIPFALSCGELDTEKAFKGEAPHGRLDWMNVFAEDLKKRGFVVRSEVIPEKGHGVPPELHAPLSLECFLLATEGKMPESGKWSGDLKQFAKE